MFTFLVVSRGNLPSLREKRIWAPKRERVPVPVLWVPVVTWGGKNTVVCAQWNLAILDLKSF